MFLEFGIMAPFMDVISASLRMDQIWSFETLSMQIWNMWIQLSEDIPGPCPLGLSYAALCWTLRPDFLKSVLMKGDATLWAESPDAVSADVTTFQAAGFSAWRDCCCHVLALCIATHAWGPLRTEHVWRGREKNQHLFPLCEFYSIIGIPNPWGLTLNISQGFIDTVLSGFALSIFPWTNAAGSHGAGFGMSWVADAQIHSDNTSLLSIDSVTGDSVELHLFLPQDGLFSLSFSWEAKRVNPSLSLDLPRHVRTLALAQIRTPHHSCFQQPGRFFSFDHSWPRSQSSQELAKIGLQPDYLRT